MMDFQDRVAYWSIKTFGPKPIRNKQETNFRFIEEAIELVQACDMKKEDVLKIIEEVYSRSKGEIYQEIGGALTTLSALCSSQEYHMMKCGEAELKRMWKDQKKIIEKQKSKLHP